jgi:hypothetical protein
MIGNEAQGSIRDEWHDAAAQRSLVKHRIRQDKRDLRECDENADGHNHHTPKRQDAAEDIGQRYIRRDRFNDENINADGRRY